MPMITEVTPVNERIVRLRISHTLSVISLVSVHAPNRVNEFSVKEALYAQLEMVVDSCPTGDFLIVLSHFSATTGTGRDGCQSCVGAHGSGSRDGSSSMLFDFAKSRRLRIAESWLQRPDLHRLDMVSQYRWCKERDRPCTCRRSLETCPELQGLSERRVCRDRHQTSRGYPQNTAQVP